MKKIRIISIVVCLFTVLFLVNTVNAQSEQYEIIDLGTLPGVNSVANGINDKGQIVGQSDGSAFLYENGSMTGIGVLEGAAGINNSGQIVGWIGGSV